MAQRSTNMTAGGSGQKPPCGLEAILRFSQAPIWNMSQVRCRFGVSHRGIVRAQTGRFPKIGLLQQ